MSSLEPHRRDHALAQRILAGEKHALEEFRERLKCVPLFLAERNARFENPLRSQDLPDIVQQCLLVIWRKLDDFDGRASLTTWIYRICVYELWNAARRQRRTRVVTMSGAEGELQEPNAETESSEVRGADLMQALAALPAELEIVIRLKHFEELTFREISRRLKITESLAKARYYRGLKRMQATLRPFGEEIE